MLTKEEMEQFLDELSKQVEKENKGDFYQEGYASSHQVERIIRDLFKEYGIYESDEL